MPRVTAARQPVRLFDTEHEMVEAGGRERCSKVDKQVKGVCREGAEMEIPTIGHVSRLGIAIPLLRP